MALLQNVRSQLTVCTFLRQCLLIPKQSISFSMPLQLLLKKPHVRPKDVRIKTRFPAIDQGLAEPKRKVKDTSETEVTAPSRAVPFDAKLVSSLLDNMTDDHPVPDMPDPFMKDYLRCYLCTNDVKVDYKNVRLLSQFVSPYTGRIYGRAITGLCIPMQRHVSAMILRARSTGYMPYMNKDPKYLKDPQPFNPMGKQRT